MHEMKYKVVEPIIPLPRFIFKGGNWEFVLTFFFRAECFNPSVSLMGKT